MTDDTPPHPDMIPGYSDTDSYSIEFEEGVDLEYLLGLLDVDANEAETAFPVMPEYGSKLREVILEQMQTQEQLNSSEQAARLYLHCPRCGKRFIPDIDSQPCERCGVELHSNITHDESSWDEVQVIAANGENTPKKVKQR